MNYVCFPKLYKLIDRKNFFILDKKTFYNPKTFIYINNIVYDFPKAEGEEEREKFFANNFW